MAIRLLSNTHFCIGQQALTLSFIKESTKLPYAKNVVAPFHPRLEIGYERSINKSSKHQLLSSIKVGYYYHKVMHHGLMRKPSFGYQYVTPKCFYFGADLNLGLLQAVMDNNFYQQNENGDYRK